MHKPPPTNKKGEINSEPWQKGRVFIGLLIANTLLASSAHGLEIRLNAAAGMTQDSIDGFTRAATYWENTLSDNTVIYIDIDFRTLNPSVLGQAGSTTQSVGVADYYTALINDVTSQTDITAVANLSPLSVNGGLTFVTNVFDSGTNTMILGVDNDDSANNRVLDMNTANAKAVGLYTGVDGTSDASITFSDSFSWDYDNADGINLGHQDFVGVAIHEIGHSLGFVSGVDTMDFIVDNPQGVDQFRIFSGLDMFRYSADDTLDLSVATASYFSIDGGANALGLFSTGSSNGDGRQASHWKDNQLTGIQLGILDPTAQAAGTANEVTTLDLLALDAIGWNLTPVPEPSSTLLVGLGFASLLIRRNR